MNTTQQPEALRFTKKPVTITASQWFKSGDHPAVRDISDSDDLYFTGMGGTTLIEREKFGVIGTLESPNHLVTPGDWIITGVQGEHYPCKPDIFEMTYAPETKLQQQGKCLYQIDEPQAKALRLAHALNGGKLIDDSTEWADTLHDAANLLEHQHARIEELEDVADMAIKRIAELEAQLSAIGAGGVEAPASPVSTYVEVRECSDCGHVGINDADGSKAACNTCEWYGDSPHEDKCPGCNRVGTMSAACPKCGSRTLLLAETHLLAAAAHGMEQDAARYQALVESGNFVPSPFDNGMWGLRVSSVPSTKAELDAAVDRVIAAQAKQGGAA